MTLYIYLAAAMLLSLPTFACSHENEEAHEINRLIVEAATLYEQGKQADNGENAVKAFEQVLATLDRIISDYPESDMAVQLATRGQVGDLKRGNVQMLLNIAREGLEREQQAATKQAARAAGRDAARATKRAKNDAAYAAWQKHVEVAQPLADLVAEGKLDEAKAQVAAITDDNDRDGAYGAIAAELARLGNVEEALETAFLASERESPVSTLGDYYGLVIFEIIRTLKEIGNELYAAHILHNSFNPYGSYIVDYLWDGQAPKRPPEDWQP